MYNKVYLILGASSDLGIDLIRNLAMSEDLQNILVICHYYNSRRFIDEIEEKFPEMKLIKLRADLGNIDDTRQFVRTVIDIGETITHIVNFCANDFHYTRLSQWDYEGIFRDMTIQVFSFAEILKAFVPKMAENHYGKVVVMLTAYTIGAPPKNMSSYVTVKYALMGLMKSVASDYGDKGININGVSPGMINTKFINNVGRKVKEFTAESNPKHRNLETGDVIPTILLLLSDKAEFINGTNINLSGEID